MKRLIVCMKCGEIEMVDGELPSATDKCVGCKLPLTEINMINTNKIR